VLPSLSPHATTAQRGRDVASSRRWSAIDDKYDEQNRSNDEREVMSLAHILLLLLIAGVCGSLAQSLVGYTQGGCLASIALGFVGAVLGTWIARQMGLSEIFAINIDGQSFPIVWSVIGASLFVAVLNLMRPRLRD